MSERTCLHCGARFSQTGRGRRRSWCYECLPAHGDAVTDEYITRAGQLKQFKTDGQHGPCCGLRACKDCHQPFTPWGHVRCPSCHADHRQRLADRPPPPPKVKTCPTCRRSSPLGRRWYCTEFCRIVGRRAGHLREFLKLDGEFVRAERWWVRMRYDDRWLAGPPPRPLEVWVTPDGTLLCPECASVMAPEEHEIGSVCCYCDLMVSVL